MMEAFVVDVDGIKKTNAGMTEAFVLEDHTLHSCPVKSGCACDAQGTSPKRDSYNE